MHIVFLWKIKMDLDCDELGMERRKEIEERRRGKLYNMISYAIL